MNATKIEHEWATFLKFYSDQNEGKKTRLGVFENVGDVVDDYWIEDGLMFAGIDIETNDGQPTIEVMLEDYTHSVAGANSLKIYYSGDGNEDGLDILGSDGKVHVLRFECG